jgi:hypothetical protein
MAHKDLGNLQQLIYDLLWFYDEGLTDDEIEQKTSLRHQTASARRRELVLMELVKHSGQSRPTRSGRNAKIWVVT